MILRLLNWQGAAGLAAALGLSLLLMIQKGETRHWRKQSGQFEQLYRNERSVLAATTANYRAAADAARLADEANAARVRRDQASINERISDEFQSRLASVRAAAAASGRLRDAGKAPADTGARAAAAVPGLSAPSGRAAEAAIEDRFSHADRLIATEQAIQLDQLIRWIREQASVKPDLPAK